MSRPLALWVTLCLLGTWAWAAKDAGPEVDRLSIAARLVSDGHHDRAAAVLSEIDREAVPKRDRARYFTLSGLVALQLERYADAVESLQAAWTTGEADPRIQVYLAQAHAGMGEHNATLTALDAAGEAATALHGTWQLRSRALLALGHVDRAYAAIGQGRALHPEHTGLIEEQLLQLVELGLTREVVQLGSALLAEADAAELTWIAVGDRLRRARALDDALAWLEETRLRFPESVDARVALAQTCLEADRPLCCGEQLQEAAAFAPRFASEAAECFRRAGDYDRALYLNSEVADPEVKVRQRLGLLLERQDFTLATALHPRLERLGLLQDEQVAYALAYAHVRNGTHGRAEALLSTLTDPALFQQGIQLREAMQRQDGR